MWVLLGKVKVMVIKLGSLFDGIEGFPLGATRNDITPIWASEIENIPISITTKHFPKMIHIGDITKVSGYEVEPVDIITFGSPCNDLSALGNRKGLEGEQSKLFLEAIRIIDEMREATNGEYPRFIIWENVKGAFSSNNGNDFKRVLEEITKTTIPIPKSNKWAKAGMVRGEGFSLAWRTFDSQYWGIPQHRERIFLVCDYRGQSAGEILFESERVSRDTRQDSKKEIKYAGENETSDDKSVTTAGGCKVTSTLFAAYGTKWNSNSGAYTGNHFFIDKHNGLKKVRRFTPLECERLMGFEDGWTDVDDAKDTGRYKALGNSLHPYIAEWILKRIKLYITN
jgi:DNA (cytosine-5)-methyltransferase 1